MNVYDYWHNINQGRNQLIFSGGAILLPPSCCGPDINYLLLHITNSHLDDIYDHNINNNVFIPE